MSFGLGSGGIQNQSEILKKNLQRINYPQQLTFKTFQDENPMIFMQIMHHVIINYNVHFYKELIEKGYEMFSKSDEKFIESVYKFLFNEFNYKPQISQQNFLTNGYLEKKIVLCNSLIDIFLKNFSSDKNKKSPPISKLSKDNFVQQSLHQDELSNKKINEPHPSHFEKTKSSIRTLNKDTSQEEPRTLSLKAHFPSNSHPERHIQANHFDSSLFKQPKQNEQIGIHLKPEIDHHIAQVRLDIDDIAHSSESFNQTMKNMMHSSMNQVTDLHDKQVFIGQVSNNSENKMLSNKKDGELEQSNSKVQQNTGESNKLTSTKSKLDRPVTVRELNEVMMLIVNINNTIQETIHKLDIFQEQTNSKLINVTAQISLLDGEVKLIKAIQNANK